MIQGPYQFKSSLDLFFRHVRKVTWLLAFEWDKRIPFWFPGFDNTLQSVDKRSQYWPIIRKALKFQRTISRTFKLQAARVEKNLKKKYGPRGEGAAHKRLKEWILDNPERIGLSDDAEGEPEYQFASGDRSDIVFRLPRNRFAVVEIETNNPEPGTFQALKYRVLKCAELGVDIKSPTVESHLVSWQLPWNTDFCRKYGIRLWRIRV